MASVDNTSDHCFGPASGLPIPQHRPVDRGALSGGSCVCVRRVHAEPLQACRVPGKSSLMLRALTLRSHAAITRGQSGGEQGFVGCGRQVADQCLQVLEERSKPVRFASLFKKCIHSAYLCTQVLHHHLRARHLHIRPAGGQWTNGG